MGREISSSESNEFWANIGPEVPVRHSLYYPLFRRISGEIKQRAITRVLDVGCGNGRLAELLLADPTIAYRGFDFSSVAVQLAIERTARRDTFSIGDARDPRCYQYDYEGIVCSEFLEHVTQDLDVIELWRPGVQCVCSVPNFDHLDHVRHFRYENEVFARYAPLIDIDTIIRVPRPLLAGMTLREYLRKLRWARERPKTMLGMMGVNTFDWYAGWFVFAGRRRA